MSIVTSYPLSLNEDTFNSMKLDFDIVLQKLLNDMENFNCADAVINIKLSIHLENIQVPDSNVLEYEAMRDAINPRFRHEISSVMQVKDKKSGFLAGEYELIWDNEIGQYVIQNIDDGQTTIFD